MKRMLGLAALAIALGGAGPSLPLPPTPPAPERAPPPQVIAATQPAPVPNESMAAPSTATDGPTVSVRPQLYQLGTRNDYPGNGFLPGSTIWGSEFRHAPVTPGIAVHVPLD
jgi:hypothetical protein